MKQLFFILMAALVLWSSCANNESGETAQQTPRAESGAVKFRQQYQKALSAYLALKDALVSSDQGEAGQAATTLKNVLAQLESALSEGGLPEGWSIAHKTGTGQVLDTVPPGVIGEQAGYNDIAILTAPDGSRYAVVVMIGRTKRPVPERMEMMHAVVGAVEDYHYAALGQPKPTPKPAQAPAPGETP